MGQSAVGKKPREYVHKQLSCLTVASPKSAMLTPSRFYTSSIDAISAESPLRSRGSVLIRVYPLARSLYRSGTSSNSDWTMSFSNTNARACQTSHNTSMSWEAPVHQGATTMPVKQSKCLQAVKMPTCRRACREPSLANVIILSTYFRIAFARTCTCNMLSVAVDDVPQVKLCQDLSGHALQP